MGESKNWVIFDGDNTLWATEALYDDARVRLCDLLAEFGVPYELADAYQRERDISLQKPMGYSPDRFPRSFVETVEHFLGGPAEDVIQRARKLGESVFASDAKTHEDVDEAFARLTPHFRLALLTAGDDAIQKRRILAFGRSHHFDQTRVVPSKNKEVLSTFLTEIDARPSSTWMIGDSLKSDVYPAVAIGMRAIHLDVPNWKPVEAADLQLPPGVFQVTKLMDAVTLLLEAVGERN